MNKGVIITAGAPKEIILEYGSGERIRVHGDSELAAYLKKQTSLEVSYSDNSITVVLKKKEDTLTVLEAIARSGMNWSDVTVRNDSLEDVFVKLVGSKIGDSGQEAPVN